MFELKLPWRELIEVFKNRLLAQHMSMADFEQVLREADCDFKDVHGAFVEADGKISLLRKTA